MAAVSVKRSVTSMIIFKVEKEKKRKPKKDILYGISIVSFTALDLATLRWKMNALLSLALSFSVKRSSCCNDYLYSLLLVKCELITDEG